MIPVTPWTIFTAQLAAHLALIPMIMYGEWWMWLVAIGVYFLSGCLGMTMTYHRQLTHKSWQCPRWITYLFTLFATLGMTGTAISWVAVHRKHHAHSDTEKDPHSPTFRGWFWSHFLSMFAKVEVKYSVDLLRERFFTWQHKHYFTINLAYAALLLTLVGPMALAYAWLVPAAILWNAGSAINSISHRNGTPHSDFALCMLTWGEGYHSQHHDSPRSSRFGRWDLGGFIIKQIEKLV